MAMRLLIFFLFNFGALALGGLFTNTGVSSTWYTQLNKAPWTPPGWVFGAAWTSIMICYSVYMAYLWKTGENLKLIAVLFALQWILNVGWNPVFFSMHQMLLSLIIITSLTVLVGFFMVKYYPTLGSKSLLILPYFVWLIIATSLNAYAYLNN